MANLWDVFYFDYWVDENDEEPTHEDYLDWLTRRIDHLGS